MGKALEMSVDSGRRLAGKSRGTTTLRCLKSRYTDLDSRRERTEERGGLEGPKRGRRGLQMWSLDERGRRRETGH